METYRITHYCENENIWEIFKYKKTNDQTRWKSYSSYEHFNVFYKPNLDEQCYFPSLCYMSLKLDGNNHDIGVELWCIYLSYKQLYKDMHMLLQSVVWVKRDVKLAYIHLFLIYVLITFLIYYIQKKNVLVKCK